MDLESWLEGLPSQKQKRKGSTISAMEPDESDSGSDVTDRTARLTPRRPPGSQEGLSGRSSSSRDRTRKRSPACSIADLASAVPPIVRREIDPIETRLPRSVFLLQGKIMAFETFRGIFPACLQTQISPLLGGAFEGQSYYCNDGSLSEDDEQSIWGQIQKIRRRAKKCGERGKTEPSWGEEVVRPLLDLSVEYRQMKRKADCAVTVDVENLTTATISPHHLALVGARGGPLEFKKVEYGFFLALGPDDYAHGQEPQPLDPLEQSVNQTVPGYVRNRPLVLFLELKKPGSEGDPLVQLGVWSSALLTRLRLLSLTNAIDLPPLPILQVVGHDWKVYYLHCVDSGTVVLHGPQVIGSTLNIQGIYQIIKVLGAAADYAVDEYWPWFENNSL